ncbi:MAG: hypothetical protein M3O82_07975 [Verrucomicrobiota bacterium]|nr:hypothetical protein [Verrucomicrobiota bacterium]
MGSDALVRREVDYVIAGGVDVGLDPFEIVGFAKATALTRDDIRPYDERASGVLPGEGCGVFVLAREEDARAVVHSRHAGRDSSSAAAPGTTAGSRLTNGFCARARRTQLASVLCEISRLRATPTSARPD